jgi:phosphatidylserine/phosphatidylglycerophosphate/cardiolipin synthase-like enzyme
MKRLDSAIAHLVTELHPDRIEVICRALEKATDSSVFQTAKKASGLSAGSDLLVELQAALMESTDVGAVELAGRIRSAAAVALLLGGKSSTELVWSGPSTGLVPVRHTEQVLTGLIDEARERIFIVSFVAYKVKSVFEALKRAHARGVEIRVLLERSADQGGSVDTDSIATMRTAIPNAEFLILAERWTGTEGTLSPKVHAKCAVADNRVALITSANLTQAAMERNMELGVLIRGGTIPETLATHLNALATVGELRILEV